MVESRQISEAGRGGDDGRRYGVDGGGEALNADFRRPPPIPRELTPAVARPGNFD